MNINNLFKEYKGNVSNERAAEILEQFKWHEAGDTLLLCAYSCDVLGKEIEAEEYYRKAKESGIRKTELKNWHMFFGSTLRWNKKYKESLEILNEGFELFNDKDFKAYILMTEYKMDYYKFDELQKLIEKSFPKFSKKINDIK